MKKFGTKDWNSPQNNNIRHGNMSMKKITDWNIVKKIIKSAGFGHHHCPEAVRIWQKTAFVICICKQAVYANQEE